MGVMIAEQEETLLSVRLTNARRDAAGLVDLLQRAHHEAVIRRKVGVAADVYELLNQAKQVQRGLEGLGRGE
jgi:hypothetical protein